MSAIAPPSRLTDKTTPTLRRRVAIALISLCLLAAGLSTAAAPAAGQSNSGIRIYDEHPHLRGASQYWYPVSNPPGIFGQDHHGPYHYTYGSTRANRVNWVTWDFSVPDSSIYDVWVWVPANHATAQVNYGLHLAGCSHRLGVYPTVDQHNYAGWVKIGRVALDRISNSPSNNLVLEVNDNEVSDRNAPNWADKSIGVSVAMVELDFNVGWEHQTNSEHLITDQGCWGTTQPQATTPGVPQASVAQVRLHRGADASGCPSGAAADCSWLDINVDFTDGTLPPRVEVACHDSDSPWVTVSIAVVSTKDELDSGTSTELDRICRYSRPGNEVYVTVDGNTSNSVYWEARSPMVSLRQNIAIRDELIASQEFLLNTYRCRFDIDTHIVPGGCADGGPARAAGPPATFAGNPTGHEIAVRDELIAAQESLLNTYRCRFDIDTHIVSGGCGGSTGPEPPA